MKKIIIALFVAVLLVFSTFVCFAEADTAQVITIPAKRVNTLAETMESAPALLDDVAVETPASGSASGGNGGAASVPSTGGAVIAPEDEYEDYGKIFAREANCYNFSVSEDSLNILIVFDGRYYIEDARVNLQVNLYEATSDGNFIELVAKSVSGDYDTSYEAAVNYLLMVEPGVTLDSEKDYMVELVYTGKATFDTCLDYLYLWPDDEEKLLDYTVTDKNTGTIDFYISNFDNTATYYAVFENDMSMIYPVKSADGVLTFCFNDVIENYIENSNRVNFSNINIYKDTDDNESTENGPAYYYDYYVGNRIISYYLDSKTNFDELKWNGIELYGAVESGSNEFTISIGSGDSEGTAANGNGSSYTQDDEQYIMVELYNETLGTKVDMSYELVAYEYENKYEDIDGVSVSFDAYITTDAPLTDNYTYFVLVTDAYSTRMQKVEVTSNPSVYYIGVYDSYNDYYTGDFTKADTYSIMLDGVANMPDIEKLDVKFLNYCCEPIAVIDRESIEVDGGCITLKMNAVEYDFNESPECKIIVYYDGAYITSGEAYLRPEGATDDDDYEKEIYYNFYTNDTYLMYKEKLIVIAGIGTNDPDFDITEHEIDLHPVSLENPALEGRLVAQLYHEWDTYRCVFEYDVSAYDFDSTNFIFNLSFDPDNHQSVYKYNVHYVYEDSVIFENQVRDFDDSLYVYGYNLPQGNWSMHMQTENTYKPYSIVGTSSDANYIVFDISNPPMERMQTKSILEHNNTYFDEIEQYTFTYVQPEGVSLYSDYLYQNSRVAVFNLPHRLYTQYKIAESLDELENASYSAMKEQVVMVLDNFNGDHYVYAQFKDASGIESKVFKTKVSINKTKPVFQIENDLSGNYVSDSFYINSPISHDRKGIIYYQLYAKDGHPIDWEHSYWVHNTTYQFNENLWFNYNNSEYFNQIDTLNFYFQDFYGNKSDVLSYKVSVSPRYTYYYIGDGYIHFDMIDRKITNIYGIEGHLVIPSQIAGVPVERIENWAVSNCPDLESISIPASVISIYRDSFNGYKNLTFYVKENSYAHNILSSYGFNVIVSANPGDINNDKVVNGADLLRLAKYFADWDVEINFETADVNADGDVTTLDLLRLAKYLAGHNVVLGE